MKKVMLFSLSIVLAMLSSCHKNDTSPGVMMRIENASFRNFSEVLSNGEDFGAVNASSTTNYHFFAKILAAPSALLVSNQDTINVGAIFIEYPSYVTEGKYTLRIIKDTTAYSGYSCAYKKD